MDNLYWTWDEDEIAGIHSIDVEILFHGGKKTTLTNLEEYYNQNNGKEKGYVIPTASFLGTDKSSEFFVKFVTTYTMRQGIFYSWRSPCATKNTHMTVAYEGCELHRSIGGVEENEYSELHDRAHNFYEFHHNGWSLPQSGIVLQFKKEPVKE